MLIKNVKYVRFCEDVVYIVETKIVECLFPLLEVLNKL